VNIGDDGRPARGGVAARARRAEGSVTINATRDIAWHAIRHADGRTSVLRADVRIFTPAARGTNSAGACVVGKMVKEAAHLQGVGNLFIVPHTYNTLLSLSYFHHHIAARKAAIVKLTCALLLLLFLSSTACRALRTALCYTSATADIGQMQTTLSEGLASISSVSSAAHLAFRRFYTKAACLRQS